MHFSQAVLLAGAIGVSAIPSGHAHLHRDVHERAVKVEVQTVTQYATQWVEATSSQAVQTPSPSAGASPSSAPLDDVKKADMAATSSSTDAQPASETASASSDASSDSPSGSSTGFCSGSGKHKRATEAQIMYTGNLGTADGCPWGSNWIQIPQSDASKYDYTVLIKNAASQEMQCICANKMGPDGKLDGSFDIPSQSPLKFSVPAGSSSMVAVQPNTQGQIICNPGTVPTSTWGQWGGSWMEVDFGNTSNGGYSGADCSTLVAQSFNQADIPGCVVDTVGGSGTPSSICPNASSHKNAYVKGLESADGLGLNLPPGPRQLKYTVGGQC